MFQKENFLLGSLFLFFLCLQSCSSKKNILYFQDADSYEPSVVKYQKNTLQPNDILSIAISALVPETAVAYNKQAASISSGSQQVTSVEVLKLQSYLVKNDGTIKLPVLGEISTLGKTVQDLETDIYNLLVTGNHLVEPSVDIRLLNAKVTVLGEVKMPGTYTFTEQAISIPQALGYAGDLTITGKRKDVLLIREIDGKRVVHTLDLTRTNWINDDNYYVRPNDVLIVNPNTTKVKTAGFLGNFSSLIGVISLLITTTVLITN